MNVINILVDSMNRRFLGTYGCSSGVTPNMDRFAKRAAVFDNHFIGAAPCMPARRELMTGRQEFFWRGWGHLEPFDDPIAAEAAKTGAVTAIVTDHYHYWEKSAHGYLEHFQGSRFIRGHETDFLNTDNINDIPDWAASIDKKGRAGRGKKYYNNVKDFKKPQDFFAPKTITAACDWLDKNHTHDKFFLWLECFDAHEPFHVPEPYKSMFTKITGEGMTVWPPYQVGYHGHNDEFWNNTSPDEIEYIKAQYLGKLYMVDEFLGKLFDKLDELDLWDDTAVILTTDHGHELGEKERFGKQPPMYDLSAHIPLMIWHPKYPGPKRISALTTAIDIYPTILEMLDAAEIKSPHGRSLLPLLSGKTTEHRDAVVYGWFGCGAMLTTKEYSYFSSWDNDVPLYWYSAMYSSPSPDITSGKYIPGVNSPVWKIPVKGEPVFPEMLFDRRSDPEQKMNLVKERPEIVKMMKEKLVKLMLEQGVPEEQFARLRLTGFLPN
ncbi:MAG: sulfatase [Treponema sp.]|nr:sulfatase [Treponema sp.]